LSFWGSIHWQKSLNLVLELICNQKYRKLNIIGLKAEKMNKHALIIKYNVLIRCCRHFVTKKLVEFFIDLFLLLLSFIYSAHVRRIKWMRSVKFIVRNFLTATHNIFFLRPLMNESIKVHVYEIPVLFVTVTLLTHVFIMSV
jgi:hypothetical protein